MTTIGIIYPDHAAEDEYATAAALLGVDFPVAHIYGTDLHAIPELLDLGSPERLANGTSQLLPLQPEAILWACTSGSFVYGVEGAREQVDRVAQLSGRPASSTSLAFVDALARLGISRVAVAASYPEDVAALFVDYLAGHGTEIVSMSSAGIDTAAEVGRLTGEQVIALAVANDHPGAEALLVPDTAMHTLEVVPELERRLGKPVLTANQVTIWQGLRLIGAERREPRLGTLFTSGPADTADASGTVLQESDGDQ